MADDPIVITGGSVHISFSDGVYASLTGGGFANADKRITRVVVRDDNTNQTQTIDAPANGKCTVTIHCE